MRIPIKDRVATITSAAKLLGISRQWVHKLYQAGQFPNADIIHGIIVVPIEDLNLFLKKKEAKKCKK